MGVARHLAASAVLFAWLGVAEAADLTVSAASSLSNAFRELAPAFEAQNRGTRLLFNFAASDTLLAQIAKGAPVDVFASADQETMDRAEAQKLLLPSSRRNFVSNELVLVAPAEGGPSLSGLADLGKPGLRARIEFPESGRWFDGGAITVLPSADPRTHTARVRVNLPAEAAGVVPGMAARVHFLTGGDAPSGVAVPAAAVLRRGEVTGVYVADGKGGFSLRQVRLGTVLADGSVEVLAGLSGGEVIALDPVRAGLLRQKR